MFHNVITGIELLQVHDWHGQPIPEHARSHGRGTFIKRFHKRYATGSRGTLEHFQVAQGELVHPHKPAFIYAPYRADILKTCVLGLLQVHKEGSGAANAKGVGIDGKALEALHP